MALRRNFVAARVSFATFPLLVERESDTFLTIVCIIFQIAKKVTFSA